MATRKIARARKGATKSTRVKQSSSPRAKSGTRAPVSRATQGVSNAELDALYETFLQQPAQLTRQQMNSIERGICTADAEWRRLALASLTKSGSELRQRFGASREAAQLAAELLAVAEDMGKRLHDVAAMLETASTRLMLSLCERADMHELIAAAKAQMQRGALSAEHAEP
jgi:hypothetical protein